VGRVAAVLLGALIALRLATPATAHPVSASTGGVEPRFDLAKPDQAPFPSDRLAVRDPAQRTSVRVSLPLPDCALERSACDDVRLLNELDGFDLSPRLAIPFTGRIDLASVTVRSVFLVRLAPGPPEATPVDRLVYDPDRHVLYARPEALLEAETRYGLVVTRELRDAEGGQVRASEAFRRFVGTRHARPTLDAYRRSLAGLLAVLARRGVPAQEVAAASVFTTGSVTSFLEHARDALERQPPEPALMAAPEGGGRAFFALAALGRLTLRSQVRVGSDAAGAFEETVLPLAALPRDAVSGVGVGWFRAPRYLASGPERRIAEGPTARQPPAAPPDGPVPFVVILPAGSPPPGGWPVAIMGHGYGGEMFTSAFLIAGTLARHGLATVAVTVVGHGRGPESALVVTTAGEGTRVVRVPGRGLDLDGDGRIDRVEGLAAGGPAVSLGLRDGLRQQVVDLLALTRALRDGLDVDGDGSPDIRGDAFSYVGQSLGGIYGTPFLALEPRVRVGVLNVPGGPIAEIARLAPVFRARLREALERRTPSLLNGARGFREELPLRGEPPVVVSAPGALAIQEYLARVEWLGRRGDPLAYARHLRAAPLGNQPPKRVLVQLAWGDRVVPNPTTSALVRAGHLADAAVLVRYDRVVDRLPAALLEPHGFLLRVGAAGAAGTLARLAQEQVARFLRSRGEAVWNPDEGPELPLGAHVFEMPAQGLPDRLSYDRSEE